MQKTGIHCWRTVSACFYQMSVSNIAKMRGIVKQDSTWDTKAMPAATFVSFPSALGIMMVLRPSGIASEQIAQVENMLENSMKYSMVINSAGSTSSRKIVTI